jgi:hypothetical protein
MDEQTSASLPSNARDKSAAMSASVGALTASLYPMIAKKMNWEETITELQNGMKKSQLAQIPQFATGKKIDMSDFSFIEAFPEALHEDSVIPTMPDLSGPEYNEFGIPISSSRRHRKGGTLRDLVLEKKAKRVSTVLDATYKLSHHVAAHNLEKKTVDKFISLKPGISQFYKALSKTPILVQKN